MGSEVRSGGAYVEIYAKSKLKAGLDGARSQLSGFASSVGSMGARLTGVAASILAGLGAALFTFGNYADDIADTAARIGVTTTSLQELTYAATQNGASMEDVEKGLQKFEATLGKAELGSKTATKTLNKYGLSVKELASMSPEQQLNAIADAIARQPDQASKAAAAMELLGKGGLKLLPMLENGAAGLDKYAQKAHELGLVMEPEDVALGAELADMWGTVTQQLKMLAATVGAAVAPAMLTILDYGQRLLGWAIALIDENRGLVTGLAVAAIVIGAVGGALFGVAGVFLALSLIIAGVNAVIVISLTLWGAMAAAIGFLLTPIGLVTLAIAALGAVLIAGIAYWLAFTETGRSLISGLWNTVSQALGGIVDAVMAMDLGLAWKIAWQGALIAFQQFVVAVTEMWEGLKTTLVAGVVAAFQQIQRIIEPQVIALNAVANQFGAGVSADKLQKLLSVTKIASGAVNKTRQDEAKKNIALEKTKLGILQGLQKTDIDKAAAKRKEVDAKLNLPDLTKFKIPKPQMLSTGPGTGTAGGFSSGVKSLLGSMGQITVQEKQLEKLEGIDEGVGEMNDLLADIADNKLVFG